MKVKICLFSCSIILSLGSFANSENFKDQGVEIFKYECRSVECTESILRVDEMQKELNKLGITILSVARGFDGQKHYSEKDKACHRNLSRINIFRVAQSDVQTALNADWLLCSQLESKGGKCSSSSYAEYRLTDQPSGVISVYKSADRLQGQTDSGIDVDTMEQELIDKKIVVYDKYQAKDGMLHSLKSGARSADINVYVIERTGLSQAVSMGYQECIALEAQGGACYPEINIYDDECL